MFWFSFYKKKKKGKFVKYIFWKFRNFFLEKTLFWKVSRKVEKKIRTNHGRRKVHKRILVILAAQPGPNGGLSCLHFNQENWMLVIRLMYTIFDFRNTKMCLMCLNLWFYGTYATSKGFRTHWTLIIGLQGHMGNFKKIKDYLKRTPWMRKKFNDLSDMFQSHVCRHGLRTPN